MEEDDWERAGTGYDDMLCGEDESEEFSDDETDMIEKSDDSEDDMDNSRPNEREQYYRELLTPDPDWIEQEVGTGVRRPPQFAFANLLHNRKQFRTPFKVPLRDGECAGSRNVLESSDGAVGASVNSGRRLNSAIRMDEGMEDQCERGSQSAVALCGRRRRATESRLGTNVHGVVARWSSSRRRYEGFALAHS